jgi:hypothetical protein
MRLTRFNSALAHLTGVKGRPMGAGEQLDQAGAGEFLLAGAAWVQACASQCKRPAAGTGAGDGVCYLAANLVRVRLRQ